MGRRAGRTAGVTGSEPAAMMAWSKLTVLVEPSAAVTSTRFGEVNRPVPTTVVTLRCLASPVSPPVSRVTTPSFQSAQRVQVDGRRGEDQPVAGHLLGLGDHLGRVQQRLGRDAAHVQADPAERTAAVDHDDLLAQVGGPERRGVAARSGAEHEHLGVLVTALTRRYGRRRWRGGGVGLAGAGGAAEDPYPAGACSCSVAPAASAAPAPSAVSTVAITVPSDTDRPPRPAAHRRARDGAGTSRVALSTPA